VTIPDPAAATQSVVRFFVQGGFFMIPLMICSVVSLAVIFLRALALRRDVVMPRNFEQEIESIQPGEEKSAAVRLARIACIDTSALGRIIDVALRHLNWPKAENNEAVQTRARHEIVRLESGLFILEIIVGIAPLLGLLGAVSGLVSVFAAFGADVASQDPHGIAQGISEALTTTIVGLAIAIPSLIAYSHFARKIETMAADMESLVGDLLTKCYRRRERPATARPSPTPGGGSYQPVPPMEEEVL